MTLNVYLFSFARSCLQHVGSAALWHEGSQLPEQGSNLHPLHCKADSYLLDQQGNPPNSFFKKGLKSLHL